MNLYNDWQGLLKIANKDLEKSGYSLLITEDEEGYYDCEVWKDGEFFETYAENYFAYFERELSDLIADALHYVKAEFV